MADNIDQTETDSAVQENNNEEQGERNMSAENQAYMKELEELEEIRKEHEEKKKKELERIRKTREKKPEEGEEVQEKKSTLPGHTLEKPKKIFYTEKKIFRHNKLNDFGNSGLNKIDKALEKAHLSSEKRKDLLNTLSAFNPSRSVLKKRDFIDFTRKFKSKSFNGAKFLEAKKEINLEKVRSKFSKRDLDKFRRAVTGEKDPNSFGIKSRSEILNKPRANITGKGIQNEKLAKQK